MAIPTLTEEQVKTWTREQKDRWWLDNVYRGDMPQLTIRSALTGFLLGGILSATNLYVGAKTGWTLGVGITSVILAFAMFKVFSRLGAKDMTILENNAMQSVATAAGYMTGPLISGLAAYMMIENRLLPWWQMMAFNVVLSIMGVMVAFPMKRRFINDEQQPFPEGRACGVVLDTLYTSSASVGLFKAKALMWAAAFAGGLKFISGESIMMWLQVKVIGLKAAWHLDEHLDYLYYHWGVDKLGLPVPKLGSVPIKQLGLSPTMDLAMFGAGAFMGMRVAVSLLIGMVVNFCIVVPIMISVGEIAPKADGTYSRIHVLNHWALWWGIMIMVMGALTTLFARPQLIISAFSGLFKKRDPGAGTDVLAHIELPLKISLVGVPIMATIGVTMMHYWFGVPWGFGFGAVPLILILALIAGNSTAMTGITPTGSLSKIPQFLFGSLNPGHPPTSLTTALMAVEVPSNSSNLLMDIKPGYMLGAKPRQQAIGHIIGITAGAIASTPLFYVLFLSDFGAGKTVQDAMVTDQFAFPSAMQWKGVNDLVTAVFSTGESPVRTSALWSMVIAAALGIGFELARIFSKGRFPLSPVAIGLGVLVPPESTMAMFAGALFFWLMERKYKEKTGTSGFTLWVETQEPICAGLIAGAALIGIGDILVKVFLLK
jgi:uncharacterized oligopeptide transporter (OPT) family protein